MRSLALLASIRETPLVASMALVYSAAQLLKLITYTHPVCIFTIKELGRLCKLRYIHRSSWRKFAHCHLQPFYYYNLQLLLLCDTASAARWLPTRFGENL